MVERMEKIPVRAVIFDLGRVLIPFEFQRGYNLLQPLCGLAMSEVRQRIATSGLVPRFEAGELESRDFVTQLGAALDTPLRYEQFCEIWTAIFLPGTLIPENVIAGIKKHYPLVLLSNTNAIHFEMLERTYPILGHFEHRVLSFQVGAMKPSPVIYRKAVELAGCRPEECFFTDDIPEYVQGARDFGIQAVQFHSAEQLQEELAARGIRWQ